MEGGGWDVVLFDDTLVGGVHRELKKGIEERKLLLHQPQITTSQGAEIALLAILIVGGTIFNVPALDQSEHLGSSHKL